jgi:hypothetical protein
MPSPLDRHRQFTLMAHAIPGDTARNDPSSLGQKIPKKPGVFKVDRRLFQAESAGTPSLE